MAANLGAHEVMELHEVMMSTVDIINQFQLYRPLARDGQLRQMMDHQLQFIVSEYDGLVRMMQNQGIGDGATFRAPRMAQPVYGLDNPGQLSPNMMQDQFDDRDVTSAMLFCHKASAMKKIMAALECADPQIRRTIQQSAVNCAEQAYEVWQFMNQKGYYQVPTLKDSTTNTVLNGYGQAGQGAPGGEMAARQTGQMRQGEAPGGRQSGTGTGQGNVNGPGPGNIHGTLPQ